VFPTIACVYKAGGRYDMHHVWALIKELDLCGPAGLIDNLIFLTDSSEVPENKKISLLHDWPGWWSKIELFRPGIFQGRVLYFDLDTVIKNEISDLVQLAVESSSLLALKPRIDKEGKQVGHMRTAIMSWTGGDLTGIYKRFAKDPWGWMEKQKTSRSDEGMRGDQGFVQRFVTPEYFEDYLPQHYIAHDKDWLRSDVIQNKAHIVLWRGKRLQQMEDRCRDV